MLYTSSRAATQTTESDQIPNRRFNEQTARDSTVLAFKYGLLRDDVRVLNEDIDERHREGQKEALEQYALGKSKKSVANLLQELSISRGMAWRDIAHLVDVSVSAIRKWRNDGAATPEKRLGLARLAAFLDLLESYMVEDPAGWLDLPMVDGYTVRHMDLYEAGRFDLLLDMVGLRLSETAALDLFDPQWRTTYRSDFEVFEAGDGSLSIRKRASN